MVAIWDAPPHVAPRLHGPLPISNAAPLHGFATPSLLAPLFCRQGL